MILLPAMLSTVNYKQIAVPITSVQSIIQTGKFLKVLIGDASMSFWAEINN
jgi:hypothetical protein